MAGYCEGRDVDDSSMAMKFDGRLASRSVLDCDLAVEKKKIYIV